MLREIILFLKKYLNNNFIPWVLYADDCYFVFYTASVLLKLFISCNEIFHTSDAP